jgi:hypothetical protein
MGRDLSTNLQTILAASAHGIDQTLQLIFPDATTFRYATAPLTLGGNAYSNDLENVGEMRYSLDSSIPSLSVGLQNKDRVLGLHVANHWQKWRNAEVIIGRNYSDKMGLGLSEWIEMFHGVVQRPNANDLQVTFDVFEDTVTPGQIVCNHTLALPCFWKFKDPKTCAYSGPLTTCNHQLKSTGGCEGRANTEHFGGMEHRYNPDTTTPGSDGNLDPGPGGGGPPPGCPRLDQYVRVKGPDGEPMAKMVCFFTDADELWQPISRRFRKTRSATIVRDQPIWELLATNGTAGFSSFSHPLIMDPADRKGLRVDRCRPSDRALTVLAEDLAGSRLAISQYTGESDDVMRIEMENEPGEENIYCSGDSPEKMFACHNSKDIAWEGY